MVNLAEGNSSCQRLPHAIIGRDAVTAPFLEAATLFSEKSTGNKILDSKTLGFMCVMLVMEDLERGRSCGVPYVMPVADAILQQTSGSGWSFPEGHDLCAPLVRRASAQLFPGKTPPMWISKLNRPSAS
jgi:hypothetical protein